MFAPWVANSSVTTAITGRSRCSIATASAIANDVQEPHVPRPTIAKSTASAELADVAAVRRAGLADLAVGLDRRDVRHAVGPQPLLPVRGDEPPRPPRGVGADAGPQAAERAPDPEGRRRDLGRGRSGGRRIQTVVMPSA